MALRSGSDPGVVLRELTQRVEQMEREGLWRLSWGQVAAGPLSEPLEFVAVEGRRYRIDVAGVVGSGAVTGQVSVDGDPVGTWVSETLPGSARRFGWVLWTPPAGSMTTRVEVEVTGSSNGVVAVVDLGGGGV